MKLEICFFFVALDFFFETGSCISQEGQTKTEVFLSNAMGASVYMISIYMIGHIFCCLSDSRCPM